MSSTSHSHKHKHRSNGVKHKSSSKHDQRAVQLYIQQLRSHAAYLTSKADRLEYMYAQSGSAELHNRPATNGFLEGMIDHDEYDDVGYADNAEHTVCEQHLGPRDRPFIGSSAAEQAKERSIQQLRDMERLHRLTADELEAERRRLTRTFFSDPNDDYDENHPNNPMYRDESPNEIDEAEERERRYRQFLDSQAAQDEDSDVEDAVNQLQSGDEILFDPTADSGSSEENGDGALADVNGDDVDEQPVTRKRKSKQPIFVPAEPNGKHKSKSKHKTHHKKTRV